MGHRHDPGQAGPTQEAFFRNPYHFVPVDEPSIGSAPLDFGPQYPGTLPPSATHDRWPSNLHTGALLVKLVTKSPLLIGAKRHAPGPARGGYGEVELFQLPVGPGGELVPAIPSTSLRGMVSNIAEAASGSALRVLSKGTYSRRMELREALSAMGLVVRRGEKLFVRPLAMPNLVGRSFGRPFSVDIVSDGSGSPPSYRAFFPKPLLKAYIGENLHKIREWVRAGAVRSPVREIHQQPPAGTKDPESWLPDNAFSWQPLIPLNATSSTQIPDGPGLHRRQFEGGSLVLGRRIALSDPDGTFRGRPPETVRGITRVLCSPPDNGGQKTREFPHGRKHEIFLPYTESMEAEFRQGILPEFPIPDPVVESFYQLADERTNETAADGLHLVLPFHPFDTPRNSTAATPGEPNPDCRFRLKTGDIVFFRADSTGRNIAEISLSSCWRKQVTDADGRACGARSFFDAVRPNLLPLDAGGRTELSLAEALFGFVEGAPKEVRGQRPARALASRVRFSHGAPAQSVVVPDKRVVLAVLGEPKPPCSTLYFYPIGGKRVDKHHLEPGTAMPSGRKWYLHQPSAIQADGQLGHDPWKYQLFKDERAKPNLTAYAQPVAKDQEFRFRIDFENLTDLELQCLCFSVAPPLGSAESPFLHKLGMGKPIGLGSVQLSIAGLMLSEPKHRYSAAGFRSGRFQFGKVADEVMTAGDLGPWSLPNGIFPGKPLPPELEPSTLARQFSEMVRATAPDRWQALKLLGQPASGVPIHYPQPETVHGPAMHADGFKWFVENERGRRYPKAWGRRVAMERIRKDSPELPKLPRRPVQ